MLERGWLKGSHGWPVYLQRGLIVDGGSVKNVIQAFLPRVLVLLLVHLPAAENSEVTTYKERAEC